MDDHRKASEEAAKAGESFDRVQDEVHREQRHFFQQLVLLNGGALILSVTFFGYISQRPTSVVGIWSLIASWVLLLAGLVASLYRTWYHLSYLYFTAYVTWAEQVEKLRDVQIAFVKGDTTNLVDLEKQRLSPEDVADALGKDKESWARGRERSEKRAKFHEWIWTVLGPTANCGLIFGLVFLLLFAVANSF
jgi:hypothetical protein